MLSRWPCLVPTVFQKQRSWSLGMFSPQTKRFMTLSMLHTHLTIHDIISTNVQRINRWVLGPYHFICRAFPTVPGLLIFTTRLWERPVTNETTLLIRIFRLRNCHSGCLGSRISSRRSGNEPIEVCETPHFLGFHQKQRKLFLYM